jgi:hypothetical protein
MYNNRGVGRLVKDDLVEARRWFELASSAAGDATDVELSSIAINLARLEPDPVVAEQRYRDLYAQQVATFGATHADVYFTRMFVARFTPDLARARAELEAACAGFETWKQPNELAQCAYEAAWLADEAGDRAAAARWMERVRDPDDRINQLARAYIAFASTATPHRAEDVARLRAIAAAFDRSLFYERPYINDALVILAAAGDPAAWEQALAICELGLVGYGRRTARARRMVAEQRAASRPVEAASLARAALPWYRAGNDRAVVDRLEQIATVGRTP